MSLAALSLTIRLHRFVLVVTGLTALGIAALALLYAARIDSMPAAAACSAIAQAANPSEADFNACRNFFALTEEAGRVAGIMAFLPLVGGLFLGVPIVAQELDRGTAPLSWWLEPTRWRWLIQRSLPVIGVAVLLWLVAGAALDQLESRLLMDVDPQNSFHHYGLRGPLVAARSVLFIGSGVLVGALLGRTLPSMLVALVVGAAVLGGIGQVHRQVQWSEATAIVTEDGRVDRADLVVEAGARLPGGEQLTYAELRARYPNPGELLQAQESSTWITWVIPGERYSLLAGREAAATAGLGLLLVGAAVPVVSRRRADPGRVQLGLAWSLRRRSNQSAKAKERAPGLTSAIRLALWPHRSEIVAGVAIGLMASIAGLLLLALLTGLSAPAHCIRDRFLVPIPPDCTTTEQFINLTNEWGGRLFAAMAVLPWVVGALIGVVVVGREIEHRTATLAWSLAPDRRRWVMGRVLVATVLVGLLLVIPSVVASEAERAAYPWAPPEVSFNNYALRGPLVVMRGIAALGVGLLAGAVVGRVLPALLVAAGGCLAVYLLLGGLLPFGQPPEELGPEALSGQGSQPLIGYSIPGERLREVEMREGVFIAGVWLTLVAGTVAVVERRRPY